MQKFYAKLSEVQIEQTKLYLWDDYVRLKIKWTISIVATEQKDHLYLIIKNIKQYKYTVKSVPKN